LADGNSLSARSALKYPASSADWAAQSDLATRKWSLLIARWNISEKTSARIVISLCRSLLKVTFRRMTNMHRNPRYLGEYVDRLDRDLAESGMTLGPGLVTDDPFVATSVLQKAIRRSDRGPAMAAARALYEIDRSRLWRRLCVIAFEDFGLSDIELTATVVAAACARKWRAGLVDETDLVALLIDRLLEAPCDRSLDRLYALAVAVRSNLVFRESFLGRSAGFRELMDRVYALIRRCERRVPGQSFWGLQARVCDEALLAMAVQGNIVEADLDICLEGRRASQCALPVLLPVLKSAVRPYHPDRQVIAYRLESSPTFNGIPAYALDARTRAGKFVLAKLLHGDRELSKIMSYSLAKDPLRALASLLFLVEGGRCDREVSDVLSDEIRDTAVGCLTGLSRPLVDVASARLIGLLPLLNKLRERTCA
jgi:hypothetical protein